VVELNEAIFYTTLNVLSRDYTDPKLSHNCLSVLLSHYIFISFSSIALETFRVDELNVDELNVDELNPVTKNLKGGILPVIGLLGFRSKALTLLQSIFTRAL
jgi:hypothetical protein